MTITHSTTITWTDQADCIEQMRRYVREYDEAQAFGDKPKVWQPMTWAQIGKKNVFLDNQPGHGKVMEAIKFFLDGGPQSVGVLMMSLQIGMDRSKDIFGLIQEHTGFDKDKLARWLDELKRTDD